LSEIYVLKREFARNSASCNASKVILRISKEILKTRASGESFARKPITKEVK